MDKEVSELQELLVNMVQPEQRASVKVIPEHVTLLYGTKSKKQYSRKKQSSKTGKLTRRESAKLGLFTLPTRQMRYEDALPLHKLWCGYMRETLGFENGAVAPEVYDPIYEQFSKSLVKIDFHGAMLSVIKSKCPTLVGLSGIVVLETKNVFKLLGKDHCLRTIPKSECLFSMKLGNMDITVFGKDLAVRPAERSVKKIKHCVDALE